jgi:hypothetical protein
VIFRGDYLFWCFGHRFSDDTRFLRERMRAGILIERAFYSDARPVEHVRVDHRCADIFVA